MMAQGLPETFLLLFLLFDTVYAIVEETNAPDSWLPIGTLFSFISSFLPQ